MDSSRSRSFDETFDENLMNDCSIAVGKATARASLQHLPALYPKDGSSLHVDEQLQLIVDGGFEPGKLLQSVDDCQLPCFVRSATDLWFSLLPKDFLVDFAGKSSGIGANNQKHFLLFLTYTSLHCLDAVPVSLCQR